MNLYFTKHTLDETELWRLEKKCLFSDMSENSYCLVEDYIDVERSPFVKYCIKDVLITASLDDMLNIIIKEKMSYENFKVKYLDIDGQIDFNRGHEIEGAIGYEINGYARVDYPNIILGVTCLNGKWYLGEYLKSTGIWREHQNRPQEYCNSLTTRVSRAIVNIASGNNTRCKLIDPCCGVGTVVIEAISMGFDILGFDINESIVAGAKRNLRYFGYPDVIEEGNIHTQVGHYDIAIVDLPYGILSITTKNKQIEILKSAGKLATKVAVIGARDMELDLQSLNFKIIDKCTISKGKFKRYLFICE